VDAEALADRQNPVRESVCYFLIGLGGDRFVVNDAATDPRAREHPSVKPMSIGAWAGYPLLPPDGLVLGSFCVIDDVPREWREDELETLATLARSASAEIHLRQSLTTAQKAHRTSADTTAWTPAQLSRISPIPLPPTKAAGPVTTSPYSPYAPNAKPERHGAGSISASRRITTPGPA
jgi:GAF domain-containing protein